MSGVENNNKLFGTGNQKYIIGEKQVYNILKDTLQTPADLTALMTRFKIKEDWTGRTGDAMRDLFRDAVIQKADDVASISRVVMGDRGAGAGIVSVLAGTEQSYLQNLVANAAAQKKIETVIQQDSVLGMKIISTLLSIGVGVMTAGKFHFSAESRDITKGDPLSIVIGSGVNFTAKIRGLEAVGQININDRETKYIKDTLKFSETLATAIKPGISVDISKLTGLTDQDKKIVEFYNVNLSSLPVGSDKALIDELSRNHMIALAKAGDGIGFKGVEAGYSLLSKSAYVGLTAQYVGSRIEAPRANGSVVSDLVTNRKSASLAELGIQEIKSADGKYAYTLPTGYSDVGGALAKIGFTLENGVYTKTALAPLGFSKESIKHINGDIENIISVETQGTKRIIQAASTKEVQVSAAKLESTIVISSKGETVDNLNENNVFQSFVNDIIKYSRQ